MAINLGHRLGGCSSYGTWRYLSLAMVANSGAGLDSLSAVGTVKDQVLIAHPGHEHTGKDYPEDKTGEADGYQRCKPGCKGGHKKAREKKAYAHGVPDATSPPSHIRQYMGELMAAWLLMGGWNFVVLRMTRSGGSA